MPIIRTALGFIPAIRFAYIKAKMRLVVFLYALNNSFYIIAYSMQKREYNICIKNFIEYSIITFEYLRFERISLSIYIFEQ